MKVKFSIDSLANIHSSNNTEWLDPVEDLYLDEGEWESLSDDQKWEFAREHFEMMGSPEISYEEES